MNPGGPAFNGKGIDDSDLFSALHRTTRAYHNDLRGAMFVCDVAYTFPGTDKVAATAGIATGDDDPNKDLQSVGESQRDQKFRGFISEQEILLRQTGTEPLCYGGRGKHPATSVDPCARSVDNQPSQVTRLRTWCLLVAQLVPSRNFG